MTIEGDIITWASKRPGWQQDVLVALANGERYEAEQIGTLSDEILAGTNSMPNQKAESIQVKSPVVEQVDLTAVADLRGVNALVDGQRLNFATTGITVRCCCKVGAVGRPAWNNQVHGHLLRSAVPS